MSETVHAAQAHFLIWIIAALIPLLIWAMREADHRLATKRTSSQRRGDNPR